MGILRATQLETDLKKLLYTELVYIHTISGLQLVVPESTIVQRLAELYFNTYHMLLLGLTSKH